MNQKKCISVKFSKGLVIFDDHYEYPAIDEQEKYNGQTSKCVDKQGPQAHAEHNFFVSDIKDFRFHTEERLYPQGR